VVVVGGGSGGGWWWLVVVGGCGGWWWLVVVVNVIPLLNAHLEARSPVYTFRSLVHYSNWRVKHVQHLHSS
jgi:hypothetical protein